jgi:hypothetical protein
MPGRFDRAIGVRPGAKSRAWTIAVGVRELGAAAGILVLERPRPVNWVRARVAGDVKDLALLAGAFRNRPQSRVRIAAAMASVTGIMALDAYTAMQLSRPGEPAPEDAVPHPRTAVTVRKDREEAERGWEQFRASERPAWADRAEVSFVPAPGDRGTEVHVALRGATSDGPLAAMAPVAAARLAAEGVKDDLRRFKEILEAGVITRSEGSPEGPRTSRFLKQRPAQPLSEPAGAGRSS